MLHMTTGKRTGRSTASKKTATTAQTGKEKPDPEITQAIIAGINEQLKKRNKKSAKYQKLLEKKRELMS
jgi:hypothetical protein